MDNNQNYLLVKVDSIIERLATVEAVTASNRAEIEVTKQLAQRGLDQISNLFERVKQAGYLLLFLIFSRMTSTSKENAAEIIELLGKLKQLAF